MFAINFEKGMFNKGSQSKREE